MTDLELLCAWQSGNRSAGGVLIERHCTALERFFRNKVVEPDELIQRTFLGCVESAHRFRGESNFRTFLLGIATMVLRNHYAKLAKDRGSELVDASSMEDLGQTPSQILTNREEDRLLLAALRRLPLELQLVVELRYWDGCKYHELAEILGIPRSTANTHLRRARKILKTTIAELALSPERLHSTLTRLDDWAEQVRLEGSKHVQVPPKR